MVRRHYNIPSLNALAAFEAAGRHMSLTRAAAELNVTPSAMSKQIKLLEAETGMTLFVRRHRALDLTTEGAALLATLSDAFEHVAATLERFGRQATMKSVSIGTTNAVAQLWLMPRLGQFWRAHQDINVDHIITDRTQDSWTSAVDLRIRYGTGSFPEEDCTKLFDDSILAVAAPDFAQRHAATSLRDVASLPLLSVEGVDWSWTSWTDFFRAGGSAPKRLAMRRFNSYVIAIQAAQDGQGVALGWKALLKPLLDQGKLCAIGHFEMPAPHSFYLTWSRKRPLPAEAETLKDWLLTSVT